ncbi:hypothetical protein BH10PSE12_BH10PSE12_07700 [soil metagenome]
MIALLRWATPAAALLLFAPAAAQSAPGPEHRAFDVGEYDRTIAELRRKETGAPLDFEGHILLAEANERAEGRYEITSQALDDAAQQIGTGDAAVDRHARLAAIRGRMLSRADRSPEAARTIVEALADSKRAGAAGKEPFLTLGEAYGIVLLRMGLAKEAMQALVEVCDTRLSTLPDGDPRLLTSLYWLGRAEVSAGKIQEARDTLKEVVRVRTLALGANHPETLQARALQALIMARAGDAGSAAERRAILDAWRARPDQRDPRIAWALLDVAEDEADAKAPNAPDRLRAAYAQAIGADSPIERLNAEAGVRLAKYLYASGRYGEALDIITDASGRSPQISKSPLAYDLDATRAAIYRALDRPADAESIYRMLIAIYDADPTLGRGNRLTLLNNLAEIQAALGHFDAVVGTQRDIVAQRAQMLGANAPLTLSATSSLAAYLTHGSPDALKEAIALHRKVLAAREALSPPDEIAVATSLHNLGTTLDVAKAYLEAKVMLDRAIAIRTRILGPDHPDTILSKREWAGILMSEGDIAGARKVYGAVAASLERSRVRATATDDQRRSFFRQSAQVYKLLAVLEAQAGSNGAFAYADAARSRTLLELTSSADALGTINDPDAVARLGDARRALGRVASTDISQMGPPERAQHSALMDAATARVSAVEADLQQRYPQLQFAASFHAIDRARLRAAMREGTALLDYVVLGDQVMLLWIGPDGTMGTSDFAAIPGLAQSIKAYLALLSAPALVGSAADPMADRAVFAWKDGSYRLSRLDADIPEEAEIMTDVAIVRALLSKHLFAALPLDVRQARRWIIIPDGPLAAIPFDTLSVDGVPVVTHTAVSYAPSLAMLIDLAERMRGRRSLDRDNILVMGAPALERAPAESPLRAWSALAGSQAEVTALTSRYGLKPGKTVFSGLAATEAQLRRLDGEGALARYKTLFFSTHGNVDLAASERNAIILMGDAVGPDSDGFVRAAELMSLHIKADLIIVSACQSGVGEWLDGEGAMGLPFALFASGAASTLLTHWSVADQSASAFMTRFLDKTDRGKDAASALQETKLDFLEGRAGERWTDPAYWAAFSFFGAS